MPGDATHQNRIDNVGRLFQAGQQTFVYNAGATVSRAPLMAMLRQIDRDYQIEQLFEGIADARDQGRRTPLVVLVEGTSSDELVGFVQRIGECDFTEMLLPCDYLGLFDWPERSFQRLYTRLISAIVRERNTAVPSGTVAREALAALIVGHDKSLAFAHQLDPEICQSRPDLLKAWAADLGNGLPNPDGGLLICFLCVELCDPRRAPCKWLLSQLDALAMEHSWCVLQPMTLVTPKHVEDWIALYNVRPALAELSYIQPGITAKVFEEKRPLRYRDAVEGVLAALEPQLTAYQPRWAA